MNTREYDPTPERHLGLVHSIALAFHTTTGRGDIDDLVQAGMVGLLHASRKYDQKRGVKFSTYASFWIARHIEREAAGDQLVRLPEYLHRRSGKPPRGDCADAAEQLKAAEFVRSHVTLRELESDAESAEEVAERRERAERLLKAMRRLDKPRRETIRLRFGLGRRKAEGPKALARRFGISEQGVMQRLATGLEQLRGRLAGAECA